MKRQTVTLTRRFLDLTTELNESDRLIVYDKILKHLFNEIPIETKDDSDAARITIACLAPELRNAQVRFDNGKIAKKSRQITQGAVCPFDESKLKASNKQVTSKNGEDDSSLYNNSNNIYNIYNNHIISNQEKNKKEELTQPECQGEESNQEKREWFAEVLEQQLERIKEIDSQVHQKMLQVVHAVANESEPYKIKNELVLPETVLEKFVDFFRTENEIEIAERFNQIISRVEQIKTTNKKKYLISSLYNEVKNNL